MSARVAAKGTVQAIAGFTFTPDRRRWGADPNVASCPAIIKPSDLASVTMGPQTQPTAEPATTIGAKVVYAPHATDPLAPTPVSTDTQP